MDTEEYNSAIKQIEKMERAIYKKGRHRWYDENGKLLVIRPLCARCRCRQTLYYVCRKIGYESCNHA